MKKIILVAVAAAAFAVPAHAESPDAASTYMVERPDSSDRSRQKAKVVILRDRRPAEVAALPRPRH